MAFAAFRKTHTKLEKSGVEASHALSVTSPPPPYGWRRVRGTLCQMRPRNSRGACRRQQKSRRLAESDTSFKGAQTRRDHRSSSLGREREGDK